MVIMKIPFSALSNRGNESSREGKLEKTIGQHDRCLRGEIFSLGALSIAKGFSSKKRLVAFHKILFTCKISGRHKNYAKK